MPGEDPVGDWLQCPKSCLIVLSLSGETNLHNPLVVRAAIEAVVGLLIEISFIATFTQRFFGR